jgi:MFS transporter, ACS family, hexuronate transporter
MSSNSTAREDVAFAKAPDLATGLRWVIISVFILSNTLNFLDRQLLAAFAPTLKGVFHLSNVQYGTVISAFSIIYAITTPFAGYLIDRIGLNGGSVVFVGFWSLAGMATGFVKTFRGLLLCRASLGLGEAGALPLLSKANATLLSSAEWGLASALGSVAVTLGSIVAPLLAALLSGEWRSAFVVAGALGLIWLAIWLLTVRCTGGLTRSLDSAYSSTTVTHPKVSRPQLLRNHGLWRIVGAYPLVLCVFILWLNWTTIFLVQHARLSQTDANRFFAWLPPAFVAIGGFFNGSMAFRWIRRGADGLAARKRIAILCAPLFAVGAVIPFIPSTRLMIIGICLMMFACQSVVGSLNIMPIDLFGREHAAFSISLLACSYSLAQTVLSPLIGLSVDRFGFTPVCIVTSLLPMVGILLMNGVSNKPTRA